MQREARRLFLRRTIGLHYSSATVGEPGAPAKMADEMESPGFGAWLRERLHARRMSQRQLARRASVHPSTVSRVLRGTIPTLSTAIALQDALTPAELTGSDADVLQLHPALLSAMLRRDGVLTESEIEGLVSTYARLVAARRRDRPTPPVSVRRTPR